MKRQQGFTLIEIAIVLVIIGLLLGGVLKGQELITSARVRNMISTQDGVKAAYFGFLDRFRALPGDYTAATTNITGVANAATNNGNGNGRIESSGATVREDILAWEHLSKSGFINGTYTFNNATDASSTTNPTNPYGAYMQVVYDGVFGTGTVGTPLTARHNIKTGPQVPVEIIVEVDRKIDDGKPYTGSFQFSTFQSNAVAQPATGAGNCTDTPTPITDGIWLATSGNPNCGGASLL